VDKIQKMTQLALELGHAYTYTPLLHTRVLSVSDNQTDRPTDSRS